jgi:lysophospholipase L1-like esterase
MGRRIGGRGVTMVAAILVLSHWSVLLANAQESQPAPEKRYRTHIVLAGDSTVTDDAGWGKAFAACLVDGAKCTNLSRGGRSSSSFREEGLWQQALDLKPDWVLIQFGHNDEPGHPGRENEPDKGYRANIEKYVDEARAAGIQPVLVTPISRRQWDKKRSDVERIDSSLARYAKVVKEIAAEKEVPLVNCTTTRSPFTNRSAKPVAKSSAPRRKATNGTERISMPSAATCSGRSWRWIAGRTFRGSQDTFRPPSSWRCNKPTGQRPVIDVSAQRNATRRKN